MRHIFCCFYKTDFAIHYFLEISLILIFTNLRIQTSVESVSGVFLIFGEVFSIFRRQTKIIFHQIIWKRNHYFQDQGISMIFIFQMEQYYHVVFNILFFYLKDLTLVESLFQQLSLVWFQFSSVLMIFQFDLVLLIYRLYFVVHHVFFQIILLLNFARYVMIRKHSNQSQKNLRFG